MGMCENVTNCNFCVMDYLNRCTNFTIVSFNFLLIKKNILYMYKITVVPFIKMLNFQSAFIPSSWIKNKMQMSKIFPKIHD